MLTVEICSAGNLPMQKNMLRTTFNCDPFAVLSFGKKTFKTRLIRHTLNPQWSESCFLHVKSHEYDNDYKVVFSIYDYETVSSNEHIGSVEICIKELIAISKKPETVLNTATYFGLSELTLKLKVRAGLIATVEPTLKLRVGFVPYKDIRRNFWLTMAKTFDSDSSNHLSSVELMTLLDTIGSTYSNESVSLVLNYGDYDSQMGEMAISFEGFYKVMEDSLTGKNSFATDEHVISILYCPICRKKIKDVNDMDVVSHVALCAHEDLNKLDRFLTGGMLTEQYASRKWFTKIVSYVSFGEYKTGDKSSANILVQDRANGQLIEERMPSYIRLGIRILYQKAGAKFNAVESKSIKRLLKTMSEKQGKKFTDPLSRKDIQSFISYHSLPTEEILNPISSFANFNEFFYRKLKVHFHHIHTLA